MCHRKRWFMVILPSLIMDFFGRCEQDGRVQGDGKRLRSVDRRTWRHLNFGSSQCQGHGKVHSNSLLDCLISEWSAVTCRPRPRQTPALFPLVDKVRGGAAEVVEQPAEGVEQSDVIIIEQHVTAHSFIERPQLVASLREDGMGFLFPEMRRPPESAAECRVLEESQCPRIEVMTRIVP